MARSKRIPTPDDVVAELGGTRRKAAKELELTTQAIGYWYKIGKVPERAFRGLALCRPQKWGHLV